MLTSQKVIDAINEKIGYEFSAELQYYAIAAHFGTAYDARVNWPQFDQLAFDST